jgi:hypothetical protein
MRVVFESEASAKSDMADPTWAALHVLLTPVPQEPRSAGEGKTKTKSQDQQEPAAEYDIAFRHPHDIAFRHPHAAASGMSLSRRQVAAAVGRGLGGGERGEGRGGILARAGMGLAGTDQAVQAGRHCSGTLHTKVRIDCLRLQDGACTCWGGRRRGEAVWIGAVETSLGLLLGADLACSWYASAGPAAEPAVAVLPLASRHTSAFLVGGRVGGWVEGGCSA